MLTQVFYVSLATALKGESPQSVGFFIAVGAGDPAWDRTPPEYDRRVSKLSQELARKPVAPEDVRYLDPQGAVVESATTRLQLAVSFAAGEATGLLRECGLFWGQGPSANLISYYRHPPLQKTADFVLARRIHLDLSARASGPGRIITRYLGNSASREFHDLENEKPNCQVAAIRFDRRIYFAGPEQATGLGYDNCAFCFGRERSRR